MATYYEVCVAWELENILEAAEIEALNKKISGKIKTGLQAEQFEVALTGGAGCPQVVLDDEHRYGSVLGNHNRTDYAGLREHHVIVLRANVLKTLGFENFDQLLIRNLGCDLGMRQRKRESHALHAEELGAGDPLLGPAIARFFQYLFQRAHFFGFFQEQPHGLFEIP